jgi:hypothetical protein
MTGADPNTCWPNGCVALDGKVKRLLGFELSERRTCYACGSAKTYTDRKKHKSWYLNLPIQLLLCRSCYRHFIWRKMVVPRGSREKDGWLKVGILTGS